MRCTFLLIVLGRTASTDYTATSFLFHTPEISIAQDENGEYQSWNPTKDLELANRLLKKYLNREILPDEEIHDLLRNIVIQEEGDVFNFDKPVRVTRDISVNRS